MTRDVEMRFSLHSDCRLIVTLINAPAIDAEDVEVIGEVFRIHARALGRIAASNAARETHRLAASAALRPDKPHDSPPSLMDATPLENET